MVVCNQMIHLYIILLATCFWPSNSHRQDVTQPEVKIPQGNLRGTIRTTRRNRTLSAFLAIPYAKPPIGDLRFASPIADDGWTGTLNASIDRNVCSQVIGHPTGDEDCLTINVYTPELTDKLNSKLLPVMVWIHGGAFTSWDQHSDSFGPEYLLDKDVVLAAPSYRLGPFGFLSTGDEVASGNWGLKDLVLALRWVQNNIEHFGGDPNRVTLFGQSAGAVCVHLLTLSDATKGLFHRYITQSGSALARWAHQPRAGYASLAFKLGKYVGCSNDTSASLITCLRGVSATDILASYSEFYVWNTLPGIIWSPTDEPDIDGAILTDSPANIFASGKIRDLPWIGGVVQNEGVHLVVSLYDNEEMLADFLDKFDTLVPEMLTLRYQPDSGAAWIKAIKSYYFNDDLTTNKSEILTNLTTLVSDALFFYPNHNALQQQLAIAVNPQYFYTFNYRGSMSFSSTFPTGSSRDWGAVHTDDIWYLFSITFPGLNKTKSKSDLQMVDTMVELWTSFAIDGVPATSANNNTVSWGAYSMDDNYLQIGNASDLGLKMKCSFFKERMEFWDSVYSATSTSQSDSTTTHAPLFIAVLIPTLTLIMLRSTILTDNFA